MHLRSIIAGIFVVLALFVATSGEPILAQSRKQLTPGDYNFALKVGTDDRTYIAHIPASYDATAKTPLVVILHGAGGNANNAFEEGNWIKKSDTAGFIAVALNGTPTFPSRPANFLTNPQIWNDGSGRGIVGWKDIDDVGFINAVIDDMEAQTNIDADRVYLTGFSNGASMTFRGGAELSKRLAAIAPVAGHLWLPDIKLDRPLPLIFIVGSADPLNPINGGMGENPWGKPSEKPAMQVSVDEWVKALNCSTTPVTIYDQNTVKGVAYKPCNGGAEVDYYIVNGMGHNWPGGTNHLPERFVGPKSNAINATDLIWTFFQAHPRAS